MTNRDRILFFLALLSTAVCRLHISLKVTSGFYSTLNQRKGRKKGFKAAKELYLPQPPHAHPEGTSLLCSFSKLRKSPITITAFSPYLSQGQPDTLSNVNERKADRPSLSLWGEKIVYLLSFNDFLSFLLSSAA